MNKLYRQSDFGLRQTSVEFECLPTLLLGAVPKRLYVTPALPRQCTSLSRAVLYRLTAILVPRLKIVDPAGPPTRGAIQPPAS